MSWESFFYGFVAGFLFLFVVVFAVLTWQEKAHGRD